MHAEKKQTLKIKIQHTLPNTYIGIGLTHGYLQPKFTNTDRHKITNNNGSGYQFYLGSRLTYWGAEVGYHNLGGAEVSVDNKVDNHKVNHEIYTLIAHFYPLGLNLFSPLNPIHFAPFIGVGLRQGKYVWKTENFSREVSLSDYVSIGVNMPIFRWGLRLMYDYYSTDVQMLALSLRIGDAFPKKPLATKKH